MKCYKVVIEQGVNDHFELIMYTLLSAFKQTVKGMSSHRYNYIDNHRSCYIHAVNIM